MRAEYYLWFFSLIAACQSHGDFEKIGDGYYYIGNEKTAEHYFDWFIARRECWRNVSNLVSVETSEELKSLQDYIVSRGYPNGSTFATSGHNFYSVPPFSWEGVDEPVDFVRWAPGAEVRLERSYLSLELTNNSLYMRQSYGHDDYYICEYRPSVGQYWLSLDDMTRILISALGCLAWISFLILLYKWIPRRKSSRRPGDLVKLIPVMV